MLCETIDHTVVRNNGLPAVKNNKSQNLFSLLYFSTTDTPMYSRDCALIRNNLDTSPIHQQGKLILNLCKAGLSRL